MSSFKFAKMTLRSLFKKPETVRYPLEKRPSPEGLKGSIQNEIEDCIFCGICAKRCPTSALAVDKSERSWAIDRFLCVQCGTCVRECPKTCLIMDPDYPAPQAKKSVETFKQVEH